ncbi:ribosome biosynthesis protein [Pichia kluyveri]|uniref:Ribosome biogenesis protein NSA1 n=1 Tax=Pichia kluyveri TaxID=36015 RepID=A0AAV5RBF6_PICKL|nr:ribosome biosynthesis protein [Pichia kluyveri]
MKIVASCEDTGALKVVIALHGTDTSSKPDENSPKIPAPIVSTSATEYNRNSKVIHLVHSQHTGNIVVTRQNGSVELYDTSVLMETEEPQIIEEETKNEGEDGNAKNTKEQTIEEEKEEVDLLPIIYSHKDVIPAFKLTSDDEKFIALIIDDSGRVVVATNKGSVFIWNSEEELNKTPLKYNLPLNETEVVEAFKIHPGKENINYIAYGGKETDLRIVKLPEVQTSESKKSKKSKKSKESIEPEIEIVFKAKNITNSTLNLRVPIHIKDILFDNESTPENFKLYTFTVWGDLRIYESKLGRKPRSSTLILPKKAPITKAILLNDHIIVCDNRGIVVKVDKQTGSQICQFKGQIGSTQSLFNFNDSILGTTGSDRYVRAYSDETRDCIVKVFISAQSNNILIIDDNETLRRSASKLIGGVKDVVSRAEMREIRQKKREEEEEESSDEEELWSKLETEVTTRRKRRKLTLA